MDESSTPRLSVWQAVSAAVDASVRAIEEVRALARIPGPPGKRGEQGPPGKLPIVMPWEPRLYHDGEVVTRNGSVYQAVRETSLVPEKACDDWTLIAAAGRDGHSPTFRGTFDTSKSYSALDVVALNGSSFSALRDDPGLCPGDGWQLVASAGKRGDKGQPGERGERGLPGVPGPSVTEAVVDGYTLLLVRSDGEVLPVDLRPVLERYHNEAKR